MPFKLTESQSRKESNFFHLFQSSKYLLRIGSLQSHLTRSMYMGNPRANHCTCLAKVCTSAASRIYQAWCLSVKLLNLPGLWSFRRLRLGFKSSLLQREFHSSPDAIIPVSGYKRKTSTQWFTLQRLLLQPGSLHLNRFLRQKQKVCGFFHMLSLGASYIQNKKHT